MGASPLLVAALGAPLLGEHLRGRQWLGLVHRSGRCGDLVEPETHRGPPAAGRIPVHRDRTARVRRRDALPEAVRAGRRPADRHRGAAARRDRHQFPAGRPARRAAPAVDPAALGSLAWLGTINSIGAFMVLFTLLRTRTSGAATSLLYLVPPVTALLAVPLLHQPLTSAVIVGMVVSGVGVALPSTGRFSPGRTVRPARGRCGCWPPPRAAPGRSPRCSSATSSTWHAPAAS